MAKDLILTKESSESEIKAYFNAVLKLSQSDNEFPINFNEVWMLVYQDKRSAIFELKDKFIQDVDFQTVRRKVECIYRLTAKSQMPRADEFENWIFDEIVPSVDKVCKSFKVFISNKQSGFIDKTLQNKTFAYLLK